MEKTKSFKAAAREDQGEHDLQQAYRGVSVRTSTRLDILRTVEKANRAADDEIDAELIFKQAGATLKLDETEDHLLASSLNEAWDELRILEFRTKYMADNKPWQIKPKDLFYSLETVQEMHLEAPDDSDHDISDANDEEPPNAGPDVEPAVEPHLEADPHASSAQLSVRLYFLRSQTEVEDDLWSFASEHKNSPRLRSHLELYKRRKTRELNKRSMAEVELDSIPNFEQPQENAPDNPAPAVENPAPKPPPKAHFQANSPSHPPNAKPKARKGKDKTTNPPKKHRTTNKPPPSFFNPASSSTSVATSSNSFNSSSGYGSTGLPPLPPLRASLSNSLLANSFAMGVVPRIPTFPSMRPMSSQHLQQLMFQSGNFPSPK